MESYDENGRPVGVEWEMVLRDAEGSFRKTGDSGVLCVQFLVGSSGNRATMKITVNPRFLAHSLLSPEDEQYDKPVPFEADLIAKQKQCE